MTIGTWLILGAVAGLLPAFFFKKNETGCLALGLIPLVRIVFVVVDQRMHPENIRSTSALDLIFGPLWPSVGGVAGFSVGRLIRSISERKKGS